MTALTPYSLMMDFAIMSVLMFVAQFLRAKVTLVQMLFLPSSMVAGFMALFLGPQFLDLLPFTGSISSYPYMLVVFLFASLFIGGAGEMSLKKTMDTVGDTFLVNSSVYLAQYAVALLIGGAILFLFFPEVPLAFTVLLPGGFTGGHGSAAALGNSFMELMKWEEALPIGQTFATLGLLSGVIGGIIYINIATRKRWTRFVKTMSELKEGMRTGMNPPDEQDSMGRNTVNTMALDPLTWHLTLVLIATCAGYYLTNYLQGLFPSLSVPMFSVAMLCGVALQGLLVSLDLNKYICRDIVTRLGSSATDYVVAFGVATIKISVVLKYLAPILIFLALGVTFCVLYVYFVPRKLYRKFWFERGIYIYGWSTGVIAIGVTLLRIVDPGYKSRTLEDYGMAYVFMAFVEIALIAFVPILIVKGYTFATGGVCLALCVLFLSICAKKYGIYKGPDNELRPGEAEVINATK